MKVAMLISRFPPVFGGAEIQCSRLSIWLAKNGHEVTVLTEKSSPEQPDQERVQNVDIIRFRTWGQGRMSSVVYGLKAAHYLFTHRGFDILHAHMIATPAMAASLAAFFLRTPVLVKVAGATARTKVLWRQGVPP